MMATSKATGQGITMPNAGRVTALSPITAVLPITPPSPMDTTKATKSGITTLKTAELTTCAESVGSMMANA